MTLTQEIGDAQKQKAEAGTAIDHYSDLHDRLVLEEIEYVVSIFAFVILFIQLSAMTMRTKKKARRQERKKTTRPLLGVKAKAKSKSNWKEEVHLGRKMFLHRSPNAIPLLLISYTRIAMKNSGSSSARNCWRILSTSMVRPPQKGGQSISSLLLTVYSKLSTEKIKKAHPDLTVLKEYKQRELEFLNRAKDLDKITSERDAEKAKYDSLRKQRLDEFMAGFNLISLKLKEMYQVCTGWSLGFFLSDKQFIR